MITALHGQHDEEQDILMHMCADNGYRHVVQWETLSDAERERFDYERK